MRIHSDLDPQNCILVLGTVINENATTEVENRTSRLLLMMLALTQMLGAAKVAELEDPTVRVQQQVLGLDIPKLCRANKTKSLNSYLQHRIVHSDA